MSTTHIVERTQERGAALIFVLWILAILTLIAGSFSLSSKRESDFLLHASERSKANALADAAIRYAVLMRLLPDPLQRWRADGTPYIFETEEGRAEIRIFDEAGKININAVQEPTLRLVLSLALDNQDRVSELVDSIQDWRDVDSNRRTHGAEAEDYSDPNTPKPQNRNFSSLEEVRTVKGMTPEVFAKVEPWFTVYTGQGGLDFSTASRKILMDLSGGDADLVDQFMQVRQAGGTPVFSSSRGLTPQTGVDMIYTIITTARIDGSAAATHNVTTIKIVPNGVPEPFIFLGSRSHSLHHLWNRP